MNYFTSTKYKKIKSIKDAKCAISLSVDELRKNNFEYPVDVGTTTVKFIYKKKTPFFLFGRQYIWSYYYFKILK